MLEGTRRLGLVFGVLGGASGRRPRGDVIDAEHTVIDVDVIEAPPSEE